MHLAKLPILYSNQAGKSVNLTVSAGLEWELLGRLGRRTSASGWAVGVALGSVPGLSPFYSSTGPCSVSQQP